MFDVHYDFIVQSVPDDETADRITQALMRVLDEEFNTQIYIVPVED